MSDDIVKAALSSGLFKKKEDPKTHRTYYVNTKTKKSTWKLTPEIVEAAMGVSVDPKEGEAKTAKQQEQLDLRRKRVDLEAQLRATVAMREKQKEELELELARLEGPTEDEIEELKAMREELSELRVKQINIEKEEAQKRKTKQRELQKLQCEIANLEAVAQNEKSHREAIQARYDQLVEESSQLKEDIAKEKSVCEELRSSVEASKQKIKDTEALLVRHAVEISEKEEELQSAVEELRKAGEAKQEIIDDIARMEREIVSMNIRLDKRVSYAQQSIQYNKGYDTQQRLEEETREVEAKKRRLTQLQRHEKLIDEVDRANEQNICLRQLIATYNRDKERLEELNRFLQQKLFQARCWVLDGKAESVRLYDELKRMENVRMMAANN